MVTCSALGFFGFNSDALEGFALPVNYFNFFRVDWISVVDCFTLCFKVITSFVGFGMVGFGWLGDTLEISLSDLLFFESHVLKWAVPACHGSGDLLLITRCDACL